MGTKMKNVQTGPTYILLKPEKRMPPTIIFSLTALKWVECMVEAHAEEVGFYGTVEEKEDYTFYVKEIFYPKHQLMNGGTCEISTEGEGKLMQWLIDHDRAEDINRMILWGHSHHTMGVFASGQDDTQALERMASTKANVLRVIVNKEGLMAVSFFDYQQQIRFDSIQWKAEAVDSEAESLSKLNVIKEVYDSQLTSSLKLSRILEIITSDPEKKAIAEKVEALKKENVPETKSYVHPGYFHNNDDEWEYGKRFGNSNFTAPPLHGAGTSRIVHHYKDGVQTSFLPDGKKVDTELNEGMSDGTTDAEVAALLSRWEDL